MQFNDRGNHGNSTAQGNGQLTVTLEEPGHGWKTSSLARMETNHFFFTLFLTLKSHKCLNIRHKSVSNLDNRVFFTIKICAL